MSKNHSQSNSSQKFTTKALRHKQNMKTKKFPTNLHQSTGVDLASSRLLSRMATPRGYRSGEALGETERQFQRESLNSRHTTEKAFRNLLSLLKEFELAFCLSPKMSFEQLSKLHSEFKRIINITELNPVTGEGSPN
jgi:hypothetical protein